MHERGFSVSTAEMRGFVGHTGEGRTVMPGVVVRASGAQTGGSFELMEFDGAPSPPPHVHRDREELFFVLEGEVDFTLGSDVTAATAGSLLFIPRGAIHGFSAAPGARLLAFVTPAGLEGFFEMLGSALASGKTSKEIGEMARGQYDLVPVGVPTADPH